MSAFAEDVVFGLAIYVALLGFYWWNEPRAKRQDAEKQKDAEKRQQRWQNSRRQALPQSTQGRTGNHA